MLITRLSRFTLIACALLSACSRSEPPQSQKAFVPPPTPTPGPPDTRPPQPAEVQEAIRRVYGQAVFVEPGRDRYFIAGDLNGDRSPDLAVVVRPAATRLAELNHELANWIRGDLQQSARASRKSRAHQLASIAEPVTVGQNDVLFAIIHGYGPPGWRHAQATQSYLLKNAVGDNMKLQTFEEAIGMLKGARRQPRLQGDVVRQRLADGQGLLYYTSAKYAWYPLDSPPLLR